MTGRLNEAQARAAFTQAIATHEPAFGTFFLARLLGLEIAYADDRCTVAFTVADWMFNPQGTLHGGLIGTALDISMGHLLHHAAGAGTTLEMKTQYLRPVTAGQATCIASFLRRGRSISFLESRMADGSGRLAAVATSTWRLLSPPDQGPDHG